ncbi:MAG: type VII toxin-antitoxin system HepT family RNase toxin [Pseudonocardiaceae bacterium]
MVDRDRVDQLLVMLGRYVRILRDLAEMPLDDYQADPRNFGSAERFLQLAIETVLSVGHHIIASTGLDQPTTYAEVFRVLGKEGIIGAEFAATLEPMARMRNRLVHHYEDIEPARIHELIRTRLSDFDLFARSITEYLDKSAPEG